MNHSPSRMRRPHPPAGPGACGWLLPQIVCCEHRTIPCFCATLELFGLPECAGELSLCSIVPAGEEPTLALCGACDPCGRIPVRVSIPVSVLLQSGCTQHRASSVVDVDTWLPSAFAPEWPMRVLILPRLRPVCGCSRVCGTRLEVQLHIELDCYVLCLRACHAQPPAPACPQLPLYPPPICR